MWFLFGVITLISFSVYFGHQRLRAAWRGQPGRSGKSHYQYQTLKNKYGITGVRIGIAGPNNYDFALKSEKWHDRLFKAIGLSVEHQVGQDAFDRTVYVVSDDDRFCRGLSINGELRTVILQLFGSGNAEHCEIRTIRANAGRLWIEYKTKNGFSENAIPAIARHVVPLLDRLSSMLASSGLKTGRSWRDPFVITAAVILAISTGLAANGLAHSVRLFWTNIPFTIDTDALFTEALIWGLGVVAALILVAILMLGRTARAHLVLIELVLIGSFGAITTSAAELRDINMELDEQAAAEFVVKSTDKRVYRGRRSRSYYVYVEDWTGEEPVRKLKVSSGFYDRLTVGDSVRVYERPGYLHYRWVERLEIERAVDEKPEAGDTPRMLAK